MRDRKGKFIKGFHSSPKTEFKKGQHFSRATEFKKGSSGVWKGKKFSPEHIKNLSLALKGKEAWNKGKATPQATIEKMRLSHLGKHFSSKTEFRKGHKTWNKGKFFEAISGSKNFNWKGGRYKNHNGYILILKPDHPFANKQGYVFEHRLIMEKKIGRYLRPEERVHHINGIKDDNRPKNLSLFPNKSEHTKHHYPKGSYFGIHARN